MKVLVLGGTGQVGQHIIKQLLDKNHHITAIVRNPGKLTVAHDNLNIVEADIFNAESLTPHFKDQEAVLSALGFGQAYKSTTLFVDSIKPILEAIKAHNITRLITCSSWYADTPTNSNDMGFMLRWFVMPMLRGILDDIHRMEEIVMSKEEINYTFVKPPRLENTEMVEEGKIVAQEGDFIKDNIMSKISRGNVAQFMIKCLTDPTWDRKKVAIAPHS